MALLEINLNPSERELRWFGALLIVFFAIVGTLLYRAGLPMLAAGLWTVGAGLGGLYWLVRPLRGTIYRGWIRATYPIGWAVSHAVLAFIYFVVLTPIGLVFRLVGRDPLKRRFIETDSYWEEHQTDSSVSRYFSQF